MRLKNTISTKEYVLSKIFSEQVDNEATDELKAVLAKRILRAEEGGVSKKSFADIANEIIRKNTL